MEKVVIKWVVNPYREDKRTGVFNPVPASEYYKELCKMGAGWRE